MENPDTNKMEPILPKKEDPQPAEIYIADIERIMSQLITLNNQNILHEPTCPICKDPLRKELENVWLEAASDKKHKAVIDFLASKNLPKYPRSVITNHMQLHLENREIRELQKIEYASSISRLNSTHLTTLEYIQTCISMLIERIMGVNSLVPDQVTSATEIEKIKSTESAKLMNIFNQTLKLRASILGEMRTSGELLSVPRQEFIDIFKDALKKTNTEGEREIVNFILSKLEEVSRLAK